MDGPDAVNLYQDTTSSASQSLHDRGHLHRQPTRGGTHQLQQLMPVLYEEQGQPTLNSKVGTGNSQKFARLARGFSDAAGKVCVDRHGINLTFTGVAVNPFSKAMEQRRPQSLAVLLTERKDHVKW